MKPSDRVSDWSIGHRKLGSLWRRLNLERNFRTIFIPLISLILFLIILNANQPTRPPPIILQQGEPEKTVHQYKCAEASTGASEELVRNLIRDGGRLSQDDPFLVEYVKTHLLTPPSSLPYNLESKLNNTSQLGQNLVALALLQNKTNGFFIECGALDGEFLSNSLLLERDFGWTGLLIEADPQLALPLRKKNRKAWTSNACLSITPFPQVMNFYLDSGKNKIHTLIKNASSMNRNYGLDMNDENAVQVLCIPLYTYLLALKVDIVDYLSLDVEAADFAVLKTIPFDKIIFRVIEVEVHWLVEGKKAVRDFLETKGYIFVLEFWPDYIFVHHSVRKPPTAV